MPLRFDFASQFRLMDKKGRLPNDFVMQTVVLENLTKLFEFLSEFDVIALIPCTEQRQKINGMT